MAILSLVERGDLARMAQVCRGFRQLVYSDCIWKPLFCRRVGEGQFRPQKRAATTARVPRYVTEGKRQSYRMRYARILWWFYAKELGRPFPHYKVYPLNLLMMRDRMIRKLEASKCIPPHWTYERPSRIRKKGEEGEDGEEDYSSPSSPSSYRSMQSVSSSSEPSSGEGG